MTDIPLQLLLEKLKWRYATKQFDTGQTIPDDVWTALEDSLVLTPSSFGLQPWHFFVIKDQATKERLVPHSWDQPQVTDCSHFLVLTTKTEISEITTDQFLKRTVDVRGGDLASLEGYKGIITGFISQMNDAQRLQWGKLQTYIALGQLMTSAATLGVDTCPMEGIIHEKYDEILGLRDRGYTTSVACALGYRSSEDKYAALPKVRFEKSDVISELRI